MANHSMSDNVLEVLAKNANQGTAADDLLAGMLGICCFDSLVAQTRPIDRVEVRHRCNVQDQLTKSPCAA
jgi:hypothetical protein